MESGLSFGSGMRGRLFAALLACSLCLPVGAQQARHSRHHRSPKKATSSKAKPAIVKQAAPPTAQEPGATTTVDAPPELSNVKGSVIKLYGSTLEVGLNDGGIALYDVGTKQRKMYIKGEGYGAVKDITMLGNRPWWIVDGMQFVRTAAPGTSVPLDIDLRESGLGRVERITVWQEMIAVHAENGVRFIDPQTQRVLTPEQALPADVAAIANQGIVTTSWKEGSGLFVVIRRYAARSNPKPGEVQELGILTAWSAPWRGEYKLLGSYTCDLVDFKDAPGPEVHLSGPSGPSIKTYGTGSIGNVQVSPEGIIALNNDQAITIPLYKDNWVTERVNTAMPPHYAQTTGYSDSGVWWVSEGKLVRASLEDG
ncbi:MAG: hypothetical protein QOJ65_2286, partial [Fimbriimonadaceae bacterium]|nr:hypothetical protein [Fimbriimonadaceae bacterium]